MGKVYDEISTELAQGWSHAHGIDGLPALAVRPGYPLQSVCVDGSDVFHSCRSRALAAGQSLAHLPATPKPSVTTKP